jgi:hypothetical protein
MPAAITRRSWQLRDEANESCKGTCVGGFPVCQLRRLCSGPEAGQESPRKLAGRTVLALSTFLVSCGTEKQPNLECGGLLGLTPLSLLTSREAAARRSQQWVRCRKETFTAKPSGDSWRRQAADWRTAALESGHGGHCPTPPHSIARKNCAFPLAG